MINSSKKKKPETFPYKLQVLLFRRYTYKNIAFCLLCTSEKPAIIFDSCFEFLPCFSLQNKQHQKYC